MKKKKLNAKLNLRKQSISQFRLSEIKGGTGTTGSANCETEPDCNSYLNLCEFTFYSACTSPSEPGISGC